MALKFQKKAWCLEQAHGQGIPDPLVISCGIKANVSFSVARFVEGSRPISADDDRLKVWEKLGSYANILNHLPVSGFGSERSEPGHFSKVSWREVIDPEIQIVLRDNLWQRHGILSDQQIEILQVRFEACAAVNGRPGICQWDICCENALIRN